MTRFHLHSFMTSLTLETPLLEFSFYIGKGINNELNVNKEWANLTKELVSAITWLNAERVNYYIDWISDRRMGGNRYTYRVTIYNDTQATLFCMFHPACAKNPERR